MSNTIFAQIDANRQHPGGYNLINLIELFGGVIVETLNYIPDPTTYRQDYYYNSRLNQLFKRRYTTNQPKIGLVIAYWLLVSE